MIGMQDLQRLDGQNISNCRPGKKTNVEEDFTTAVLNGEE